MADCPQRDRANGPPDEKETHGWSSAPSHSIIVGLARLGRRPLPAGLRQRSEMSPERMLWKQDLATVTQPLSRPVDVRPFRCE